MLQYQGLISALQSRTQLEDLLSALADEEPEVAALVRQRVPGWTGDSHRLSRTVVLPEGLGQRALDRIAAAEQEMDHHARRTDGPDGVTFEVWTHARGVVTELDVRLAERISAIVENP